MATWTGAQNPGSIHSLSTNDSTMALQIIDPVRTSIPTSYSCQGSLYSEAQNKSIVVQETVYFLVQGKMSLTMVKSITTRVGMYLLHQSTTDIIQ